MEDQSAPQDLRSSPLPMSQRRALRYETPPPEEPFNALPLKADRAEWRSEVLAEAFDPKRVLLSFCRQVQRMAVPVVSEGESWRRRNAKLLREGKKALREFLYFFSPWRKALQLIGGESGNAACRDATVSFPLPTCQSVKEDLYPQETLAAGSSPFLCCCDSWCCSISSPFC